MREQKKTVPRSQSKFIYAVLKNKNYNYLNITALSIAQLRVVCVCENKF